MKLSWDVIVVGAGAAGLFAAATAAARGRSTLLVEKNRKLGVKILMSGGTRCNITQDTTWKGIADAFGRQQGRFLKFALATLPPEQLIERFDRLGVSTKVESTGKVFPVSDKAIDVRDALVRQAREAGVTILTESAVQGLRATDRGFRVATPGHEFRSESLILTTGGQSYPGCGTTGDGYHWLSDWGHRISPPRPALTPIRSADPWVRQLSGVTIPEMKIRVKLHDVKQPAIDRDQSAGSFLFTHTGCSGPAVLNVSRVITDPLLNVRKSLICNWLPALHEQALRDALLQLRSESSGNRIGPWFSGKLPRRLVQAICEQASVDFSQPAAELGNRQVSRLIDQVTQCEIGITGTMGFAKAEVTAGGVDLRQVETGTMASKIVPGLFLAGEILDVDGPIGGYNFQAAFSTGFVAGSNA